MNNVNNNKHCMAAVAAQLDLLQLSAAAKLRYSLMLQELSQSILKQAAKVIGLTGGQGSGKTTLARLLALMLQPQRQVSVVSLDDYYLAQAERQLLAKQVHPLLAQRGVPGTHQVKRLSEDLQRVKAGLPVQLPQFDKSLDQPIADRPLNCCDLLIIEGWCLGLKPLPAKELLKPINNLEQQFDPALKWRRYVNQQLKQQYLPVWQQIDYLIDLKVPDWQSVCRWRLQQEQQLLRATGRGMSEQQLTDFMQSFERWSKAQQQQATAGGWIQLDLQHQVVDWQFK